jgi:hypothetical protein
MNAETISEPSSVAQMPATMARLRGSGGGMLRVGPGGRDGRFDGHCDGYSDGDLVMLF